MTIANRAIGVLVRDLIRGTAIGVLGDEQSTAALSLDASRVTSSSDWHVLRDGSTGGFDTLVALDSFHATSAWTDSVKDWLRVVRPGGRLIFDAASADHVDAVASAHHVSVQSLLPDGSAPRFSGGDIFTFAGSQRLAVRAILPYGAIHALESWSFWLRDVPTLPPSALRRLLSWGEADPQLSAFIAFLERHVFGVATTIASGRFLAVIEKSEPDEAAAAMHDRYIALERWLRSGRVRLDAFAERSEIGIASWFSELLAHLEFERNRVFAALLLSRAGGVLHFHRALAELPTAVVEEFNDAERMLRVDTDVAEIAAVWASGFKQRELICDDVDLRGVFVDSIAQELLNRIWFNA